MDKLIAWPFPASGQLGLQGEESGLTCPPCGLHAGALQQVVANDPFAQRLVSALSPTLTPILDYASRTPFFSSILTNIGASDNPVVSSPMHARCLWWL